MKEWSMQVKFLIQGSISLFWFLSMKVYLTEIFLCFDGFSEIFLVGLGATHCHHLIVHIQCSKGTHKLLSSCEVIIDYSHTVLNLNTLWVLILDTVTNEYITPEISTFWALNEHLTWIEYIVIEDFFST